MKKIALASVAALIATPAFAAPGDTASADGEASATIVAPITLTSDANLDFGAIVADKDVAGTVVIAPGSDTATYNNVENVGTSSVTRAQFTVGGETGQSGLTYTATANDLTSNGNTMGLTLDISAAPTSISGTASDTFFVGGTLSVAANQPAGDYTGSYTLTANYQ
ncbi:MAG: DUF4402 domain-containing protein [Parerythrobacter sp.]